MLLPMRALLLLLLIFISFSQGSGQELFEKGLHEAYDYRVLNTIKLPDGELLHITHERENHLHGARRYIHVYTVTDTLGVVRWRQGDFRVFESTASFFRTLPDGSLLRAGVRSYCSDMPLSTDTIIIQRISLSGELMEEVKPVYTPATGDYYYTPVGIERLADGSYLVSEKNTVFRVGAGNNMLRPAFTTIIPYISWISSTSGGAMLIGRRRGLYLSDTTGLVSDSLIFPVTELSFKQGGGDTVKVLSGNTEWIVNEQLEIIEEISVPEFSKLLQAEKDDTLYYLLGHSGSTRMLLIKDTFLQTRNSFVFSEEGFYPATITLTGSSVFMTGTEKTVENHQLVFRRYGKEDLDTVEPSADLAVLSVEVDSINIRPDRLGFISWSDFLVSAVIKNTGPAPVSSFSVSYKSSGDPYDWGPAGSFNCSSPRWISSFENRPLAPGDSIRLTLGRAYNQSFRPSTFTACAWVSSPDHQTDINNSNDQACIEVSAVSVEEIEAESIIRLSPNPSSDHITLTGLREPAAYHIFDLTGRTVATGTVVPWEEIIGITGLVPGLYLISIRQKTGSTVLRFLKE